MKKEIKTFKHSNNRKKLRIKNKKRFVCFLAVLLIILALVVDIVGYFRWHSSVKLSDEGYKHAAKYENCIVLNGIDVSEHQGRDINWKKVKGSGVDFVFIRAGYRGANNGELFVDKTFNANVRAAKRVGLMVGAYYYSQATSTGEAVEEAKAMLDIVGGYDYDLPLVIDYEIYPGGRLEKMIDGGSMNTASMYHDIVLAFCKTVENAGYDAGIYGNTDMFTHYMDAALIDKSSNLWVAEFAPSCSFNGGYRFWQCSESAEVGGIDKPADHDYMYINPEGVTKVWYTDTNKRTSLETCHITLKKDSVRSKRKGAEVQFQVSDAEGRRLREGRDYTSSYVKNSSKGTAYVVVRGIGEYRDIIAASYKVK